MWYVIVGYRTENLADTFQWEGVRSHAWRGCAGLCAGRVVLGWSETEPKPTNVDTRFEPGAKILIPPQSTALLPALRLPNFYPNPHSLFRLHHPPLCQRARAPPTFSRLTGGRLLPQRPSPQPAPATSTPTSITLKTKLRSYNFPLQLLPSEKVRVAFSSRVP